MAIPGHPPKTTYRQIAQKDFGVLMCASQVDCPKGLGWRAHWHGRVDRAGTIHWKQADVGARRRGMRNFAKLLGMVFHREWWSEPKWYKLYLQNTYAFRVIRDRYHYRVKAEWSHQDRLESQRLFAKTRRRPVNIRKDGYAPVWRWWQRDRLGR